MSGPDFFHREVKHPSIILLFFLEKENEDEGVTFKCISRNGDWDCL